MTQSNRLNGGLINRGKPLNFNFDGRAYQGYEGDTLASALMANGVRFLVDRSSITVRVVFSLLVLKSQTHWSNCAMEPGRNQTHVLQ